MFHAWYNALFPVRNGIYHTCRRLVLNYRPKSKQPKPRKRKKAKRAR